MEFAIKLFALITSAISLTSTILAIVASKRSKAEANAAKQAQVDTENLYKQFLQDLSAAAKSSAKLCDQQIVQNDKSAFRSAIKQEIADYQDNFFTFSDLVKRLNQIGYQIDNQKEILDILNNLEKSGMIICLSKEADLNKRSYHRF